MSVRIGIGPGLGMALSPGEYWRWVDYCESAGIDSIWHSDQLLGASLEPVTMLAALAARTTRMQPSEKSPTAPTSMLTPAQRPKRADRLPAIDKNPAHFRRTLADASLPAAVPRHA